MSSLKSSRRTVRTGDTVKREILAKLRKDAKEKARREKEEESKRLRAQQEREQRRTETMIKVKERLMKGISPIPKGKPRPVKSESIQQRIRQIEEFNRQQFAKQREKSQVQTGTGEKT
ncbi:hypothetical protein GEMRC1_006739 [Eukaryota sp. GEM-RC1]